MAMERVTPDEGLIADFGDSIGTFLWINDDPAFAPEFLTAPPAPSSTSSAAPPPVPAPTLPIASKRASVRIRASPLSHSPSLLTRGSPSPSARTPKPAEDHNRSTSTGTTFSTFSAVDSGYGSIRHSNGSLNAPSSPSKPDRPSSPEPAPPPDVRKAPAIVQPFWEFSPHPSTAALRKLRLADARPVSQIYPSGTGTGSVGNLRRSSSLRSTSSLSLRRLRRRGVDFGGDVDAGRVPERKSSRLIPSMSSSPNLSTEPVCDCALDGKSPRPLVAAPGEEGDETEGEMSPAQMARFEEDEADRERKRDEARSEAGDTLEGLGIRRELGQPGVPQAEAVASDKADDEPRDGVNLAKVVEEEDEREPVKDAVAGDATPRPQANGFLAPPPKPTKLSKAPPPRKLLVAGPTSLKAGFLRKTMSPTRSTFAPAETEGVADGEADDVFLHDEGKKPFHPTRPPSQADLGRALACAVVNMDGRAAPFRSLFSAPPTFLPSRRDSADPLRVATPTPEESGGPVIAIFVRFWNCGYCQEYAKQLSRVFAQGTEARRGLEEAKARVAIIGTGSWKMMKAWRDVVGWEGTVYTDPTSDRALFKALGMTRNTFSMGKDSEKGDYLQYLSTARMVRNSTVNAFKMPMKYPGAVMQLGGEFCFTTVDQLERQDPSAILRLKLAEASLSGKANGLEDHYSLGAITDGKPVSIRNRVSLSSLKRTSLPPSDSHLHLASGTPRPDQAQAKEHESGVRCLYANRMTNSRDHGPFTPLFAAFGVDVPRAAPKAGVVGNGAGSIKRTFKTVL